MQNKNNTLQAYILQLGKGELKVLSSSDSKVKATLSLEFAHGRLMSKQTSGTLLGSTKPEDDIEETKGQDSNQSWYPLKLMLNAKKSRMLYFETRRERKEALVAILTEQGFQSQLDQYRVIKAIDSGCSNPVMIAEHKLTGGWVVIKSIEKERYESLQAENGVTEDEAHELCRDSPHVISLIEKFQLQGDIYLVTKYASGQDLL